MQHLEGLRIVGIAAVGVEAGELPVGLIVMAGAQIVLLQGRIEPLAAVEKRRGLSGLRPGRLSEHHAVGVVRVLRGDSAARVGQLARGAVAVIKKV